MKRFSMIFLAVCLMFSTGCSKNGGLSSSYRAIENLKLVHTLGFDVHKEGLLLSVSGGEAENEGIIRLSASGKNISDALSAIQNYSGKEELYYAHTRYVLVGQAYAEQGIGDIMQYLESSNQLRSDLPLLILRSGTAKELIEHAGGNKNSTFEILEAVVRNCTQSGSSYPFTCGEIASSSAEYGSALACALELRPTKKVNSESKEEEVTPVVCGYGILKEGKLVDFLSEDASRGVNLLLDELGTGTVTITFNHHPYSLKIRSVDTTLRPTFGEKGTMTNLTVEMDIQADLEEHEQAVEIDTSQLSRQLSKVVRQWIEEVLRSMRNNQTDYLGLGARIAVSYPRQWESNPLNWETQLKTLPMKAAVDCKISRGENEVKN